jgi:hypothetical protein
MGTIKFLVKGSAIEPYEVTFIKDSDKLNCLCSCPAGENFSHCKHRINILNGNTIGIVSDNESEVETIQSWLKGTELETILKETLNAEAVFKSAEAKFKNLKKKLARVMVS